MAGTALEQYRSLSVDNEREKATIRVDIGREHRVAACRGMKCIEGAEEDLQHHRVCRVDIWQPRNVRYIFSIDSKRMIRFDLS